MSRWILAADRVLRGVAGLGCCWFAQSSHRSSRSRRSSLTRTAWEVCRFVTQPLAVLQVLGQEPIRTIAEKPAILLKG